MKIEASQVIDRPVSDVFRWYADNHVENHPRWDTDLKLEKVTEGPIREGTVIRRQNTRYETPVEETMEITEYERNKAMSAVIKGDGYEMPGRATFEELGPSKTRITLSVELPDSIDRDLIQNGVNRSVQNIKELIESDL